MQSLTIEQEQIPLSLNLLCQHLSEFPISTVTNNHKLCGLKQHKFFSHCIGGQKCKLMGQQGCVFVIVVVLCACARVHARVHVCVCVFSGGFIEYNISSKN